jgi:threonyl-tRNA synthetase
MFLPTHSAPPALQLSPEEAEARIKAINEPYKLEILQSIRERDPTAPITIYHIGETDHPAHWWDLCAGPHVESTGAIKADAFELETVAGAYWRGDEKNAMLQVGEGVWGLWKQLMAKAGWRQQQPGRHSCGDSRQLQSQMPGCL